MTPTLVPSPRRFWIMHMRWTQLLFMHWPVAPRLLAPLLPPGLELDLYDGQAWLGIVPFRMSNVRPRFTPPVPGLSIFPELNVRTYVKHRGRGGVWFFSLEASSRFAVRAARIGWHLSYFDARMSMQTSPAGEVLYESVRTHRNAPPANFRARYAPTGPSRPSTPGALDDFLTNRLSLFSADSRARVHRGDIAHVPWKLSPATAEIEVNTMTDQFGFALPNTAPLLHYVDLMNVQAWRIQRQRPDAMGPPAV